MGLDLKSIPPDTRKEYIIAGRKFGSEDVLDQGRMTLTGIENHAAKLVEYGFGADDVQELKDACEAEVEAGVGRQTKLTDKKSTSQGYLDAMRDAQQTRLRARSVLKSARRMVKRSSTEAAADSARSIDAVLEKTSVAGEDADRLATQLDQLRELITDSTVAATIMTRGGPKAATDLAVQAAALRSASQAVAVPRGTPEHTEMLDLLDGIVLSLVRAARDAAETASKELGEPALLAEFELTKLYPPGKAKPKPAAPTAAPAPAAPGDKPAAPAADAPKND